jgi:hypothetical protein
MEAVENGNPTILGDCELITMADPAKCYPLCSLKRAIDEDLLDPDGNSNAVTSASTTECPFARWKPSRK